MDYQMGQVLSGFIYDYEKCQDVVVVVEEVRTVTKVLSTHSKFVNTGERTTTNVLVTLPNMNTLKCEVEQDSTKPHLVIDGVDALFFCYPLSMSKKISFGLLTWPDGHVELYKKYLP